MSTFSLTVRDAGHELNFDAVESFIGADASGSFGVLANAEPLLAALAFGLARFRTADATWHYLALPGAVLRFAGNRMSVTATHFLCSEDMDAMSSALENELQAAENAVRTTKAAIHKMEEALMRKLWEMSRGGGYG